MSVLKLHVLKQIREKFEATNRFDLIGVKKAMKWQACRDEYGLIMKKSLIEEGYAGYFASNFCY